MIRLMRRFDRLRVVGLTGGIGSGKTEVARCLRGIGIPVLDADRIAREQMRRGGEVHDRVVAAFGEQILGEDGEVDRRRLAARVFRDPNAIEMLNRITHPPVLREVERRLDALAELGIALAVVEAALLVETGLFRSLDGLIVVTAPEDQRIRRVVVRDRVTEDEVRARIAMQTSEQQRLACATIVIQNDGPLDRLRQDAIRLAFALLDPVGGA